MEHAGGNLNRLLVHQLSEWVPYSGERSVRNGLTRSLRDNLVATSGQFVGEAWQAIAQLLSWRAAGSREHGHSDGTHASAGLESYLAMVEGTDRYGHLQQQ